MIPKPSTSALGALALCLVSASIARADFRLINGKEVEPGKYREVIKITSNGAGCTATVVGPRTILTAAHCAANGATMAFKIDNKTYSAKMTRSPLYNYPKVDHDIAVGVTTEDITGIEPATIGGKAKEGMPIFLLGYGCVQKPPPGQPPQSDGKLRIGETVVTGFTKFDMVSRRPDGAALCFGDNGGPTYMVDGRGKQLLVGVNSKGNMQNTNWSTRTDLDESQNFLKEFAQTNGVQICGINAECSGSPPPPPSAPKCSLSASPAVAKVGENITLSLVAEGKVTEASIDGTSVNFPTGNKQITASAAGNFTARGRVVGPGGTGTCEATYIVETGTPPPPEKPTCRLTATPEELKVGETVTLEIETRGNVTSATIDNVSVSFPVGKRVLQPAQKGTFTATGLATGPGGTGSCTATYRVDDGPSPPPETPNFSVVPAYCGDNTLLETKITQVCLAVLKKDASVHDVKVSQVLVVTYSDSSKEVMPIIARKGRTKEANEGASREDLVMYANGVARGKFLVLDTRPAVLTKMAAEAGGPEVPVAIEGRSAKGRYYLVEKLSPFSVSLH